MKYLVIIESVIIIILGSLAIGLAEHIHNTRADFIAVAALAVWIMCLCWQLYQLMKKNTGLNQRAKADHEQLRILLNSLTAAVVALDENGLIILYNGAALALFNTNEALNGQRIDNVAQFVDADGHPFTVSTALTGTEMHRRDLSLVISDGSYTDLDLQLARTPQAGGGYVLVMTDITQQKTIDQERDELISVVSHELRTPVAIAEANLSTALLPGYAKIDPKAHTLVEQAHQNLIFLANLIRDLTTLSKLESRVTSSGWETVDLTSVITETVTNYQTEARAKHLTLVAAIDPDLGTILSIRDRVSEVLQNFISNALKYTAKGSVRVTATRGRSTVTISVHDTGIGLSASDKQHIFEKFFRSEDYRTRQTGGTGLGLYITRKVATKIGGTVMFTSRLNHGSVFSLELPLRTTGTETHLS